MKSCFYAAVAVILALSMVSCTSQTTSTSGLVKEPVMPRADFEMGPTITNNILKTKISFSKQDNQYIAYAVILQTLWQTDAKDPLKLEDVESISHGYSFPTSTESTFSKCTIISLSHKDMANYGLTSQNKKVRLKVVVEQAEGSPKDWQHAKAEIFFSKWLDYKSN